MSDSSAENPATDRSYPTAGSAAEIAANIATVRARIDTAAARVGRDGAAVRLLPVSKTVPEDRIRLAVEAGCSQLGENKVQEAKRKWENLQELGISWSVIGHLQRNKAKDVAAFAAEFQALDSVRVADALERRLELTERTLDVLVQVNTSGEESKFGLDPNQLLPVLRELRQREHLHVQGLMTLAILSTDHRHVRPCFKLLRDLRDRAIAEDPELLGRGELSMGMSGDYELAVEEGATIVRVGQAIFGARATPDSHYWPDAAA